MWTAESTGPASGRAADVTSWPFRPLHARRLGSAPRQPVLLNGRTGNGLLFGIPELGGDCTIRLRASCPQHLSHDKPAKNVNVTLPKVHFS